MIRTPNRYRILGPDLAQIELTRGLWTLIDLEDLARLLPYRWYAQTVGGRCRGAFYAAARPGPRRASIIYMHRFLVGGESTDVDHRNRDTLDNRKQNLRPATRSQNIAHGIFPKDGRTSQYRGVFADRRRGGWIAKIQIRGHQFGAHFTTENDAAEWYNARAREHFGDFAFQNDLRPPKEAQH